MNIYSASLAHSLFKDCTVLVSLAVSFPEKSKKEQQSVLSILWFDIYFTFS